MFKRNKNETAFLDAVNRSQAVIHFDPDGTIIEANDNFLALMGFRLEEIQGKHHEVFVTQEERSSDRYRQFWRSLADGEFRVGTFKRLTKDGKEVWIQASYNPILDDDGRVIRISKIASDVTETGKAAESAVLLANAMSCMSANIMIADNDRDILFMNESLKQYFQDNETAIRQDFPSFDATNLVGTNIDQFHKNPVHQETMLSRLKDEFQAELTFGGRTTRVIACPIFDEEGNRTGTVAEWARHSQLMVEDEIRQVVTGALEGDLSQRISIEGKVGFLKMMSEAVNQLVGIADEIISETSGVMQSMAKGDLTSTINGDYQGSFLSLKNSVNDSVEKLTEVVGSIQAVSESVQTGANEIAMGNSHLSQRTEEQASSLEETASSMEEMTATVRQNADNASKADELAKSVRENAENGGNVVREAVAAMSAIAGSSEQISAIIGVIDEIAFQTNLLALNASVEAARAGDQGRGFAVVASEVRNLAGRSAVAAKEIKELIQDSGQKVDEGTRLVNRSGETLESIVSGVNEVSDIVGEIAAASFEQSTGVDEVNKAVCQLDELTQQNSALVEESAAASESMGDQAAQLATQMRFFTTRNVAPNSPSEAAIERRANDRPWTAPAAETTPAANDPLPRAAAVNDDLDWNEF